MWLDRTKNYSPNGGLMSLMVIYHARNKRKGCQTTRKNISHWGAISSFSPLHLSLCTLVDTIQRQPHRKRKQTLILGSSTGVLVGIDVHKYISTAWAVFGIPFKYICIYIYTSNKSLHSGNLLSKLKMGYLERVNLLK